MADRPSDLPRWATDAGSRVEPPEGKKDEGWQEGEKPPAGFFNWLFGKLYDWLAWLEARTFDAGARLGVKGLESDGDVAVEGKVTATWSEFGPVFGSSAVIGRAATAGHPAVVGNHTGSGSGVSGVSLDGEGISGRSVNGIGVVGRSDSSEPAVLGEAKGGGPGVEGRGGGNSPGVLGEGGDGAPGVKGLATGAGPGVLGEGSADAPGVQGVAAGASHEVAGVRGVALGGEGMRVAVAGVAAQGPLPLPGNTEASGAGVYGTGPAGVRGHGGWFGLVGSTSEGAGGSRGAPLRLRPQPMPTFSGPEVFGAIYYDSVDNKLRVYTPSGWVDLH